MPQTLKATKNRMMGKKSIRSFMGLTGQKAKGHGRCSRSGHVVQDSLGVKSSDAEFMQ
ncbi:hypothetical protein D3C85_1757860 [compost metagenome]